MQSMALPIAVSFSLAQVLTRRSSRKLSSQGNFLVIISKMFVHTLLKTDRNILAGEVVWNSRFWESDVILLSWGRWLCGLSPHICWRTLLYGWVYTLESTCFPPAGGKKGFPWLMNHLRGDSEWMDSLIIPPPLVFYCSSLEHYMLGLEVVKWGGKYIQIRVLFYILNQ